VRFVIQRRLTQIHIFLGKLITLQIQTNRESVKYINNVLFIMLSIFNTEIIPINFKNHSDIRCSCYMAIFITKAIFENLHLYLYISIILTFNVATHQE
jgi:hypothetical protein